MTHFMFGGFPQGVPGNDAFTKILLHMDGSNGGTTFTDVNAGGSAKTWTATNTFGTSTTTTANKKFGTASLVTSNTVTYISTPYSTEFDLGAQDFTIEFQFNNNGAIGGTAGGAGNPINSSPSVSDTTWYFSRASTGGTGSMDFTVGNGVGVSQMLGSTSVASAAWHHIEASRESGLIRFFIDGIQQGSSLSWAFIPTKVAPIVIGIPYVNAGSIPNAMYDEFRLSVGVARHTANFTPPISAYS